jgi:hypothetical protein
VAFRASIKTFVKLSIVPHFLMALPKKKGSPKLKPSKAGPRRRATKHPSHSDDSDPEATKNTHPRKRPKATMPDEEVEDNPADSDEPEEVSGTDQTTDDVRDAEMFLESLHLLFILGQQSN